MKVSSNKMFHDKTVTKMNGRMEQLSWFVTFFWVSDTCKNLMTGSLCPGNANMHKNFHAVSVVHGLNSSNGIIGIHTCAQT